MQAVLSNLVIIPYVLMIAIGMMLPSDGQHGILSPKSLSFLLCALFLAIYIVFKKKIHFSYIGLGWFFFSLTSFLLFWLLVSMVYDETTSTAQFDQLKLFLVTAFVPITTLFLCKERLVSPQKIFKVAIYANFGYAFFKVVLVVLHLVGIIDIWELLRLLGIRFMRMNIYGGLERLQTSVDIATPFILFFLLQSDKLGINIPSFIRKAFIVLGVVSTFLSFSRFLLFVGGCSFLLHWITFKPHKMVKTFIVIGMTLLWIFFMIGPETLYKVVEQRFFSSDNYYSDQARSSQAATLLAEHAKAPLLGKGLGGYAPDEIRDIELLHSYEVQWLAFLMQFGSVGILLILIPVGVIVFAFIKNGLSRSKLSFLGIFGLWLLAGFTNPFLISLTSGIIYSLFLLAAEQLHFYANQQQVVGYVPLTYSRLNSSVGRAAHS